jgi:hypothetical protein
MSTFQGKRSTFETFCDRMEVTQMHRPDPLWSFTDAAGHVHRWHVGGEPVTIGMAYDPLLPYETPTLVWVKDGEEWWEDDDEPHPVGHLECAQCGDHVTPRYTTDSSRHFIPGLRHFLIDGVEVTEDEFRKRLEAEQKSSHPSTDA